MATKPLRLAAPDFARLIHRHGLSAEDVQAQGIIVPKAFAATVECAADSDDEKRVSEWVISTAAEDRMGDTIKVSGWKLTEFRKGGSILYGHNRSALPVGKPLKVQKDADALRLRMEHATVDQNPIAEQVFQLVRGGHLRGNSVGFRPLKWEFMNADEPWAAGIRFLQQELLEDSIVPVPANPEALLQSVGKGLDVDLKLLTDWQRLALDGECPSLGAHHDDIAASLKALTGNPVSVSVPADVPPEPEPEAKSAEGPELSPEHCASLERPIARHDRYSAARKLLLELTGDAGSGSATSDASSAMLDDLRGVAMRSAASDTPEPEPKSTESAGGGGGVAASSPSPAGDTPSADTTKDEPTASAHDAVALYLDELAANAKAGDAPALEELRSVAAKVQGLAKDIDDAAPYFELADAETMDANGEAFVFDLTEERDGGDLIEVTDDTIAAAVAAAVTNRLSA